MYQIFLHVSREATRSLKFDNRLHLSHTLRAQRQTRRHDIPLYRRTQLQDLPQCGVTDPLKADALLGANRDEPLVLQKLQSLTHRCSAHDEHVGYLVFRKHRPGQKALLQKHLLDFFIGQFLFCPRSHKKAPHKKLKFAIMLLRLYSFLYTRQDALGKKFIFIHGGGTGNP